MEFISTRNFDSDAESVIWDALKAAFENEPGGYCWHKYPITSMAGPRLEPDFLILHPKWGVNVIEVKGCFMANIEAIDGHVWYMKNWYDDQMSPVQQAEKHMWSIVDRLKEFKYGQLRDDAGYCKVTHRAFVAFPFITQQEWNQKFEEHPSAPKWQAIFSTNLDSESLKDKFENAPVRKQQMLSDEEWNSAIAVLRGSEALHTPPRRPTKRVDSKAAWLRQVEQQMRAFDIQQHKVAIQTPAGPQRIRGLAGTGKTVVLAQKAAYMHVNYPDWDIAFTYYSRSLVEQVENYIRQFVQQLSRGEISEPNWKKVHVLYGWGGYNQNGLYRELCQKTGTPYRNFTDAQNYFATVSGRVALDKCCQEVMANGEVPELYDAILIDEAQDFGVQFFRLCYQALRQPKRIIWGYDEVQSLEDLEIPTAETLFGQDADGKPLVNLDGLYPGEIEKDMILYHCYRNPRPVLVASHAFGLGLRRKGGAVQFIDSVAGWVDIGYEVQGISEGKMETGQEVTLYRPEANSPHMLEKLVGYQNLVSRQLFASREEELEWIMNDVAKNIIDEELRPEEIAIIAIDSRKSVAPPEYQILHDGLTKRQINSVRIGTDSTLDTFKVTGAVTITSVFRAKGNEASLVYVYGFESVGSYNRGASDIIRNRNLAFTAMTRTKGWLMLTGVGKIAKDLFAEIDAILEQIGKVSFVVPDMANIKRNLETYENQRRRHRLKASQKSWEKALRDSADIDLKDLPPELLKQLKKKLLNELGDVDIDKK
jgi:superfamily I DNA and RNA helicase